MRVGVFTALLAQLSLDDVLKKLKSLNISTVELGTGNYPGDPHCKLSMLDNKIELHDFKQKIADYAYFYFGTADPEYYGIRGRRIEDFDFVLHPTRGVVVMSSHLVTRARDVLDRAFGNGPLNWLRRQAPVSIVGHSYYVYEIR